MVKRRSSQYINEPIIEVLKYVISAKNVKGITNP
jgi:hypothetical protein